SPSQLSSMPFGSSGFIELSGMHAPYAFVPGSQVAVPGTPASQPGVSIVNVHATVVPGVHSSTTPSQSSSRPLRSSGTLPSVTDTQAPPPQGGGPGPVGGARQ